ncbi:hypothetical protein B5S30_g3898 [[Candida] boidinii]|nr:hypothetical protein B5S30_g3898 [[Candida] boidinii]
MKKPQSNSRSVRSGCWTCRERQKKCDEGKPNCQNCIFSKLECKGYGIRLLFDFEDHKYKGFKRIENGVVKYGFTGRPKWKNLVTSDTADKILKNGTVGSVPGVNETNDITYKNVSDELSNRPQKEIKMFNSFTNTVRAKYYGKDTKNKFNKVQTKQGSKFNFKLETKSKDKKCDEIGINQMNDCNSKLLSKNELEVLQYQPNPGADNKQNTIEQTDDKFYDALFESLQFFLPSLNSTVTSNFEDDHFQDQNETPVVLNNLNNSSNDNYNNIENYNKNQKLINKILNHFHLKLMPRISANPNSLWPELAIKYCGFEIAKSCFISLSGLHLVGKEITQNSDNNLYLEKNEILEKSAFHINKILEYLIEVVQEKNIIEKLNTNESNENNEDKDNVLNSYNLLQNDHGTACDDNLHQTEISTKDSFILILLIYVQVLYGILESGRSAISRFLFKSFARIVRLQKFESFAKNHQCLCMVISLSWWDTIAAITSPDCRLPYCDSDWYGFKDSKNLKKLSTETMSGCPGEIFVCMYNVCELRNKIKYNKIEDKDEIYAIFIGIERSLLQYRNYVSYDIELPYNDKADTKDTNGKLTKEEYFVVRLKVAKCWMLAVYTKLIDTAKPKNHKQQMSQLVLEYLDTYSQVDPNLHILGQMVWPMLQIGSLITDPVQMEQLRSYSKMLFHTVSALNIQTLVELNENVWASSSSLEDILSGKEWLQAGIDFLPL